MAKQKGEAVSLYLPHGMKADIVKQADAFGISISEAAAGILGAHFVRLKLTQELQDKKLVTASRRRSAKAKKVQR